MNGISNLVKADKIIRWSMTFSFILMLFQAGFLAIFYVKLPPVIPLFNQFPWGEDRLGTTYEFLLPLIITAIFYLFNYAFLRKLYTTMPLVSRIIGITTLLTSLLAFIFVVRTLQLVL